MEILKNHPRLRWCAGWLVVNWRWLKEGRAVFLCALVLVLAAAYILCANLPLGGETRVRFAGMVLQIAGIGTVVCGLDQTRKLFGLPGIFRGTTHWLKSWPWRGPPRRTASINVPLEAMSASVNGQFVVVKAERTIEQRVELLEAELIEVRRDASELRASVTKQRSELEGLIGREAAERDKAISMVSELLSRAQTGGINLSLVGLVWLATGVIMTSIPAELACAFGIG